MVTRNIILSILVAVVGVGMVGASFNFSSFNPFKHLESLNGGIVFSPVTFPTVPPKVKI